MNSVAVSAFRGVLLAAFAGAGAAAVLWLGGDVPAKIHGWFLAAAAVLFAISEVHFRNLLTELNAVLRRPGYSVGQMEVLMQTIPPQRNRVWRIWNWSQGLKLCVGVAAAALQWEGLTVQHKGEILFFGYALLFYSLEIALWAHRNYRQLEGTVDRLQAQEVTVKEQKRLRGELEGTPHDFAKDETAKGYTKPSRPLKAA